MMPQSMQNGSWAFLNLKHSNFKIQFDSVGCIFSLFLFPYHPLSNKFDHFEQLFSQTKPKPTGPQWWQALITGGCSSQMMAPLFQHATLRDLPPHSP